MLVVSGVVVLPVFFDVERDGGSDSDVFVDVVPDEGVALVSEDGCVLVVVVFVLEEGVVVLDVCKFSKTAKRVI